MKKIAIAIVLGLTMGACASNVSSVPHADGPGSAPPTSGPTLCRDGTAPPCNDR